MKKRKIKEQGITLIALVVTIVVLLILAGVSIAMLTGENGIVTQAQRAKEDSRGGEVKERVEMAANENRTIDYTNGNAEDKTTKQEMIEELSGEGKLTDEEVETLQTTNLITIGSIEIDFGILEGNGTGGGTEEGGKRYDNDTTVTIGGEEVSIPGGATISKIPGEYEDVDEGVVIYIIPKDETPDWEADEDGDGIKDVQEKYDQFVWVPVPNAVLDLSSTFSTLDEAGIKAEVQKEIDANRYPMAIKTNATDYIGVLYQFTEEGGKVKVEPLTNDVNGYSWTPLSDDDCREPAYLESSSYADGSSYNNTEPKVSQSLLQQEFNIMADKVSTQKGFWVGRYETSNMASSNSQDTTNKVKIVRGTTSGINNVDWYRMYAQQKAYRNLAEISSSRTSSMIWGSQWDQIMIWMKEVKNTVDTTRGQYYITNAVGMGNYGNISVVDDGYSSTSAPAETGCFKTKNIYDLAGNVYDWTLEASSTSSRENRGSYYKHTGSFYTKPSKRSIGSPTDSVSDIGSRSTLY